jgi:hypothetical protein
MSLFSQSQLNTLNLSPVKDLTEILMKKVGEYLKSELLVHSMYLKGVFSLILQIANCDSICHTLIGKPKMRYAA